MSVETAWYEKDHIILVTMDGELQAEDIIASNAETVRLLREAPHQVFVIADTSTLTRLPMDMMHLNRALSYIREPNLRAAIAIGLDNYFVRFIVRTLTDIAHLELKIVDNFDDALAYIKKLESAGKPKIT